MNKQYEQMIKEIAAKIKEDGIATASVKDGRMLCLSLQKLKDLVKQTEEEGRDYCLVFIKDPATLN